MKTKSLRTGRFLLGLVLSIIMVAMCFPTLAIFAASGVILGSATAAATINDTVTTNNLDAAAANLLRPEISNLISKVRKDIYPLDTIMREVGKVRKINSIEWKYYTKDERGIKDETTAAYVYAGARSASIPVTNPQYWTSHDIAIIPEVLGGDGKKLRALVSSVDMTNNRIVLTPINGRDAAGTALGDFMPAIGNAVSLSRIGNGHGQTDAQTDPVEIAPYDTFNYSQIFMAQVEESLVNKQHLKEVDLGIMDYKEDAIIDMRAQGELAMLFGYPKKDFYDPNLRKTINMVGGADYFITKSKEYTKATAIDNKIFNAWAKYIFTGNNGSDKRLLFAGNSFLERIMNADLVQKQLQAGSTEIVAGIKFTRIETIFGQLLIRRHQIFDEVYGYTDNGLVLDLEHIERGIYEATTVTDLDLDKTGQKRVEAKRILEHWSMAFKNLETHCWLKGV